MLWLYDFLQWCAQLVPGTIFWGCLTLIAYGISLAYEELRYTPPMELEQPREEVASQPGQDIYTPAERKAIIRDITKKYKELAREETADEGDSA